MLVVGMFNDCFSPLWHKIHECRGHADLLIKVIPVPSHWGSEKNCWDESLHIKDTLETNVVISGREVTAGGSQQNLQFPLLPEKGTDDKVVVLKGL